MKYWTLFSNGKLLKNVTDDMNSTESWSESGLLFDSYSEANACANNWHKYDIDVQIVEMRRKK